MRARRAGEGWAAVAPAESQRSEQLRVHPTSPRPARPRRGTRPKFGSGVEARTFADENPSPILYTVPPHSLFVIRRGAPHPVRVQVVYALLYAYFTSGAGRDARTHTLFLAELREFIRDTKPFSLHLRNSYGTRRNILKKEEDAKRFRKISLSSGQVILSVEAASSPSAPCPILMDKSSLGARSQWRSGGVEVDGWGRGGAPHRARGRPHGVVPRSALGWR